MTNNSSLSATAAAVKDNRFRPHRVRLFLAAFLLILCCAIAWLIFAGEFDSSNGGIGVYLDKLQHVLHSGLGMRTVIHLTSPRVEFPPSAVKEFAELQDIRKAGKQAEVQYLELGWMTEFLKRTTPPDANDKPALSLLFLKEFKNLKGLNVNYLTLTEDELQEIGQCHLLTELSLSGIEIVEPSGKKHRLQGSELRYLNGLTNLEVLDLSQSEFSGGLQDLAGLPRLHTLILSSFEHLNDASVAQLKELPHLRTLILAPVYMNGSKITITDAGLASLKELPSLQTLYVGYHGKWSMPIDKLRALLPAVAVKRGWQEQIAFGPDNSPPPPTMVRPSKK